MDWVLAVVKRSSDEPVVHRVSESETVEVSETVFANDASLGSVSALTQIYAVCCGCLHALLWIHRYALLQHWEMPVDGNCWH
jgi:hypothetical protein